jgi:hypothetical protein
VSLSLTVTFVAHCLSVALCSSRVFSAFFLLVYISARCVLRVDRQSTFSSLRFDKFHPQPAQSPDLNPIENVWQIVKAIVANYPIAKSVEELEEQGLKAWRSVRPETVRNLIENMSRRVQAVVQTKGGTTSPIRISYFQISTPVP